MSIEEYEEFIKDNPPPTSNNWKDDLSAEFQEWYDKKIRYSKDGEEGGSFEEDERKFKIVFEYYDNEDNYIQDKLKLDLGFKSPYQIKEMAESTKTAEFFKNSEEDCNDVGLKLIDLHTYVTYNDNMKATMYIQFKVDIKSTQE